jgi:hypothetical protein
MGRINMQLEHLDTKQGNIGHMLIAWWNRMQSWRNMVHTKMIQDAYLPNLDDYWLPNHPLFHVLHRTITALYPATAQTARKP